MRTQLFIAFADRFLLQGSQVFPEKNYLFQATAKAAAAATAVTAVTAAAAPVAAAAMLFQAPTSDGFGSSDVFNVFGEYCSRSFSTSPRIMRVFSYWKRSMLYW